MLLPKDFVPEYLLMYELHIFWLSYNFLFPGLIKAIQLDYSEAHKNLMNATRKAPQHVAAGFKQHVCRNQLI